MCQQAVLPWRRQQAKQEDVELLLTQCFQLLIGKGEKKHRSPLNQSLKPKVYIQLYRTAWGLGITLVHADTLWLSGTSLRLML